MKILITGGLGFLGSNLAQEGMKRGHNVVVLDNFSKEGTRQNLEWLSTQGKFTLEEKDVRHAQQVEDCVKKHAPDAIFHTAGQVAMTTSISNPRLDFETNALGTLNVLEATRKFAHSAVVIYSSTNKVYGDFDNIKYIEEKTRYSAVEYLDGFDEKMPLEFHSPYGCSKGAADQYLLDYHRIYGIKSIVFRHSSMYGSRQFATADQGWVGWFVDCALKIKAGKASGMEISGTGKQVRDLLYASDMTDLYFTAAEKPARCSGEAYNIGGGMKNSMSLLELFTFLENRLGIKINVSKKDWRVSDQKVFVADIGKIKKAIGWAPKVSKEEGLEKMIGWCGQIGR